MRFFLANDLKVPLPNLSSNRFTDRSKYTEMLHIVLDMLITCALEQPQGCWCNVELGNAMLLNNIPVAGEVWIRRCTFKDDSCYTEQQWCVHDVCVTSDPSDITAAEEDILVVDIEDVLAGCSGTN
jgi:hypothetical protein